MEHNNKDIRNEFGNFAKKPEVPKCLYSGSKIFLGLAIFLVVATFPLWKGLGKVSPAPDPKLDTPAITKMDPKERKCVEDTQFMRANHMRLLVEWREAVVRDGLREYTGLGGKKFNASLSNTCLECHSNKAQFCDQCHNYVAVTPNCWGCHVEPGKKLAEAK